MVAASQSDWRISPLSDEHRREGFDSGVPSLDNYLVRSAGQDSRRHISACFILHREGQSDVLGYYTLSSHAVALSALPPVVAKKLPRYPTVPCTLLGRLAISVSLQGQGLGKYCLLDALHRSWLSSRQIASFAVVVDAKDDVAARFYQRYDFVQLPELQNRLFLPMTVIGKLFIL